MGLATKTLSQIEGDIKRTVSSIQVLLAISVIGCSQQLNSNSGGCSQKNNNLPDY